MIFKKIRVNTTLGITTNCYIILEETSKEAMVVDPGGEIEKIIEMLEALHANVKYIYLTHCHGDHIGGVTRATTSKRWKNFNSSFRCRRIK